MRRSARRSRTVTAYRQHGRTVVLVPASMSEAQILQHVEDLLARLAARERRSKLGYTRLGDPELQARGQVLSGKYLQGRAVASSIRWVDNQNSRWGSCTTVDGSIRLSSRLRAMPEYVVDAVLLHELAHLIEANHGPRFHALLAGYPHRERADAFLSGASFAWARPDQEQGSAPAGPSAEREGDDCDGTLS